MRFPTRETATFKVDAAALCSENVCFGLLSPEPQSLIADTMGCRQTPAVVI